MVMPDVNLLVLAHREDAVGHERYARWLEEFVSGEEPFALSESVMHGFVRVVTNPRVYKVPTPIGEALAFLDALLERPNCVRVRSGAEHWRIFWQLCEEKNVRGNLVADAAHAALAIESGCEWISADTDFARFVPPLRYRYL